MRGALVFMLMLYPAAQVLWLGRHVVVLGSRWLQTAYVEGFYQPVVCCCNLLLRIYGWAVVILVRSGCWVRLLACDSERIGRCGKYPNPHPPTPPNQSFPMHN